ncbi:HNH/endonuclease VII fold putative polymorphic toxin [Pseudomonas leptonychotis]|uniref:HNH/endonuclease VII fold putative polymorphic toxin n=1 Tax=Pseudomonas leptonychotis TaxID=2448482 RepID=UPI0038635826
MNLFIKRVSLLSLALASSFAWASTQATERNWSYTYNSLGLIETANGPRTDVQDVTTYSYDGQGHLTSVTNALGHITQLSSFDSLGNPQSITDANGVQTSLTYTPQGWLASASTAGSTTSFEHDAVGLITKVTRGDGSSLSYTWDDARRLTKISNNLGETIEYSLDAMGNRTAQRLKDASNSLTQQQSWVYDELGRLLRSVGAGGQTSGFQYDLNDNPTVRTNPKQHSNTQAYDALDRLVSNADPLGGVTALAYDAQDNLTQVQDPRGVTTQYQYDGLGNLTKQISPDSGTTTFSHDAAGNVISKTDARGVVTTYTYDALNRLTGRQYPANPALNVQYHYDMTGDGNKGIGRLTAVQDASGVIGYTYDARGNLVGQLRSVALSSGDHYDNLGYGYDGANQLARIDYPQGFSIVYPRNAAGQVSQVQLQVGSGQPSALASNISYLPFGPLKSLTWGNGLSLSRSYDQDYRLTLQAVGGWNSTYGYDGNSNITTLNNSLLGDLNYNYDALDRLTEEKASSTRKTYSYDATGNRLKRISYTTTNGVEKKSATQTLTSATNSNRLLKNGSFVVVGDAAGNTLQQTTSRVYVYNEQGRLHEVRNPTNLFASYSYNALGQRTLKRIHSSSGAVTTTYTYLYGADGQLLGQVKYGSTGKITLAQYWVWLDGLPLAGLEFRYNSKGAVTSTNQYYLHSDHLNTPRLATDASQTLLWSWKSDAFGVGTPNADVDGNGIKLDMPLRFPGQQYDAHSALNYNYFRDYDPETGRYVESDPIGLEGGLNTYGYVEGNPVNFIDPLGLAKLGGTMAPPCVPGFETMICSPGGTGGFGPMGGLRGGLTPQGELAYCPIPAGLGRSGALGSAKRDLGIPRAQHPDAVTKVPMTSGGKSVLGLDGKPVMTREYIYTRPDGTKVVIQDHSAGHKFGQKGVGDQGPHFNVRPPENTRTGSVPGTQNHYSW